MADNRSIPHDPALPALQTLFSGDGASAFVADQLSEMTGDAIEPGALDISYVRYRPGKSCVVGWSYSNGSGRTVLASGRAFHDDRGEKLIGKQRSRAIIDDAPRQHSRETESHGYLANQRLLLQLFPLDLQLATLPLAADPAWVARMLECDGTSLSTFPVSYKPWRRCVFRYDFSEQGQTRSMFGKVFRDHRGEDLLRWHGEVGEVLCERNASWSVPQARQYVADARLLLFDAVEGAQKVRRLLRPALKDDGVRSQLLGNMTAAANGLLAFQSAQIVDLPQKTPADLLVDFRRDGEGISRVAPDLHRHVSRALDELERGLAALEPEPLVTTHGAFRHDQLLHANGKLIVLDLDTICLSGASADAGNFLGYLDLTAIRRPRLKPVIDACAETFIQTVESNRHTKAQWRMWYRAAAHIKKALRAFFALEPDWPEISTQLLFMAIRTLTQLSPRRAQLHDTALPAETAADRREVRTLIAERAIPALFPGHTLQRVEVEYSRYKAGREHVTLYKLSLDPPVEDKQPLLTASFGKLSRLRKSHQRAAAIAPEAALLLPDDGCLMQAFPLDARLPRLWEAADPARASGPLGAVLPAKGHVQIERLEVLRYRPGRRCVLHYSLIDEGGIGDVVAKVSASSERAERSARVHAALAAQGRPGVRIPGLIGFGVHDGILFMEYVPGSSLGDVLESTTSNTRNEASVRAAAGALARFHDSTFDTSERRSLRTELDSLKDRLEGVRQAMPALADDIGSVLAAIGRKVETLPPEAACTIHGEYKPNQLLLNGDEIGVVDLDRVCLGDPAIDVGNFAAVLIKESALEGHTSLEPLAELFVQEYRAARPSEGVLTRAHAFQSIALLRMLVRSFERAPRQAVLEGEAWQPLVLLDKAREQLQAL